MSQPLRRTVLIFILAIGICFRFLNLDREIYWHDETYTSLRYSGHTEAELIASTFNGEVIPPAQLQKYQHLTPEKTWRDVVDSLALEDPHHPPLYYLMGRFWVQRFGDSIAGIRSLSAVCSLLAFPCIYGLCRELFASALVGEIAVALIAMSPFHILYAREARPYSLWTVTILLSSWAFWRFYRQWQPEPRPKQTRTTPKQKAWVLWLYLSSLAIGFYTFLLSGVVVVIHGNYAILLTAWNWLSTRNREKQWWLGITGYLTAVFGSLLLFSPWLFIVNRNFSRVEKTTGWTSQEMPFFSLLKIWLANISRLFFDLNFDSNSSLVYAIPPILISLAIVGYSIYFLIRKTPPKVWLFVVSAIAIGYLSFIVPDLLLGGRRSSISRYLIPGYLGIQMAVAYFLASQMQHSYLKRVNLGKTILALILTSGIVSGYFISDSASWWHKKNSHYHPAIAEFINELPKPLLISSDFRFNFGEILAFSHILEPQVRLLLVTEPNIPQIPDNFTDVFLFNPSQELKSALANHPQYQVEQLKPTDWRLWQVKISPNQPD